MLLHRVCLSVTYSLENCAIISHIGISSELGEACVFVSCGMRPFFFNRISESVHHHTLNGINQQDAATSQVYYLLFKYSSTCFGHPHAHHRELQQLQ